MKNVSEKFKILSKKVKQQNLRLSINAGELTVQEVHLMPVNIFNAIPVSRLRARKEVIAKELTYSFEGQLFKTIMQQVEITVKNASEIKGKNVDFKYGILVNNDFEYVDMGEYYIKDVEDDKNKEELVVTGYDKMLNFMKPFKQSDLQLTYPCKMSQLVRRMGEVCGVELYSMDFFNADLVIEEDFFTTQQLTHRDVLEKIAQATLTTIFIKENKLYLCKIGDSVQTLDTSFLSNLVIGEKFGPINALVLGRGSVEDNIESVDSNSINANGRCEIRFDENEFVDNKRAQVVDTMLEQIKGLEYYTCEASNLGLMWLEPCDVITSKDRENSEYKTIYLSARVTINTGISGEMDIKIPETTTTEYKVTSKEEKKALRVERLAKKNEGLIQDIIEENTETSNKLTQHEQTIDSMKDTLKSQETKIETIEGKADTATTEANNAKTTANTAKDTANNAATQVQTVTNKVTEVEKTVDGITQNVSAVEEKVTKVENTANTAKSTADNANNTANSAKQTADQVNADLTNNHYTKTETNAQIKAESEKITQSVSKTYSTKNELGEYVKETEVGTQIEQNYEHVKVAWNQISEFIQMMIVNNNASLAILDENKNLLMSLDKTGQHFHDGNKVFGEMGVKTLENNRYIAFSVDGEYGQSTNDGMAWGVTTKSDNKFFPVLFLENFHVADKDAGNYYGQLVLTGCDLILGGESTGIVTEGIRIVGNLLGGIEFVDDETGENLLSVFKDNLATGKQISMLNGSIQFFENQLGTHSFRIGQQNSNNVLVTDNGDLMTEGGNVFLGSKNRKASISLYPTSTANVWGNLNVDGKVYANNVSSDKRLKKNIKKSEICATKILNKLEIKSFDWKKDNKHINAGFIAQQVEEIDPNFALKQPIYDEKTKEIKDYKYYIDTLPIVATLVKGFQEQQETIEKLTKRIENLEKGDKKCQ